ncbi:heme exporter protein CcmD [Bosea sp. (in: a-proteobacteria)]|uniref:heme exporter protein CcmD n=1 Tax=Bosea sp. (in: a-proteobacteria) TaxID=1871050 RepID=UPI00260424C8|nr:heme exporter protein CcmD [Bosea sp. (in: a-proteobacteria)]MCO5090568.1 heme exporter protein CcmD [Bosea sp. (in: a-proteobacteria)]
MTGLLDALGPHAGFILASYGAAGLVLGGLTLAILRDHAVQKRTLEALERRRPGRERR